MKSKWAAEGRALRDARERSGMTVIQAAASSGLSDVTIRNMEHGYQRGSDDTRERLFRCYKGSRVAGDVAPGHTNYDLGQPEVGQRAVPAATNTAIELLARIATAEDFNERVDQLSNTLKTSKIDACGYLFAIEIAKGREAFLPAKV